MKLIIILLYFFNLGKLVINIFFELCAIYQIQGTCAGGFEDVRALFENNFRKGHEVNAQLCIYVDGNVVVDLYGTAVGDAEYGPDTLSVSFTNVRLTRPLLAQFYILR